VPKFSVFIHALRVQGVDDTLRSVRSAPEILVIHNADPSIVRLCGRYGAREKVEIPGVTQGAYAMDAFYDWILLLKPGEQLSGETHEALVNWRQRRQDNCAGYLIRTDEDFRPQLRFVNRSMLNWVGEFPPVPTQTGIFPGMIHSAELRRAA